MIKYFSNINDLLEFLKNISETHNLYIFGASPNGLRLGTLLTICGIKWSCYLDNYQIGVLGGKQIYNPNAINFTRDDIILITIKSSDIVKEVYMHLRDLGLSNNQILIFYSGELCHQILVSTRIRQHLKLYMNNLKKFKNTHKNERCFVIGNGPSLTLSDLNRLKNEYCFACNEIYNVYNKTNWRPTYYFCLDFQKQRLTFSDSKKMHLVSKNSSACFFDIWSPVTLAYQNDMNFPNLYFLNVTSIGLRFPNLVSYSYDTSIPDIFTKYLSMIEYFSSDCSRIIYGNGTVLSSILQLAVYMGFNEIYLLGVDNSYASIGDKKNTKDHAIILDDEVMNSNGIIIDLKKVEKVATALWELGYYAAKQYADKHGIKIYNATRGGRLEVFTRVDFDCLF